MVAHHLHMKTVRIYGSARNVREAPTRTQEESDIEVWLSNSSSTVLLRCPRAMNEWTRWFNLHSHTHMVGTYPSSYSYYQTKADGRPIFLQKVQPDVPTSVAFPREAIQARFATSKGPMRYFTCSVTWLIALAIFEGFDRIELWGFELRDTKPGSAFAWERPCVAYWIHRAREEGVDIWYQKAIEKLYEAGKMIPGDPEAYDGPLYGYSTKPEPDWDPIKEDWIQT